MNSDDFERKGLFFSLVVSCAISPRLYISGILDEYHNALDVSSSMKSEKLRSCEQKLIELDNKDVEHFFAFGHYCWLTNPGTSIYANEEIYATCVYLHLIRVFCIPGQEEKKKLVQVHLNKVLHTMTEDARYPIFERYLSQRLKAKSNLTDKDLLTGQIDPQYEFLLKLCYWDIICAKNDNQSCKEFLKKNADFLVSIFGGRVTNLNWICKKHKKKLFSCKMLLSLLNIFHQKIPTFQGHNKELLTNLLADLLIQFSTKQINEAFYLYLENSCVSKPTIVLELAKTFLDISINPKIPQHKKSIIEEKIQTILISHDISKTALPPTTEFTHFTGGKMDHKRIINICINIVKTESKDINIQMYEGIFCAERKAIENEVEMIKRSQETETLVLLMLLLITITCTGHHKSAKLKKYLSLKYEYAMASLYLLWCSGDIEVHPGPSLNKKSLPNDSSIQRRWIQNISPKILVLLPDHEQSKYKPTKKVRNERENREHFKALLKTCQEEKVHVPKMYLAEINAWETMKYKLLHKLFVYRCEIETIIASLQDFLTCGGSTIDLSNINVSFDTELKTNEIAMILGKDQRPKDKSQLMVYITRHIAGISIKCAHGKDPDAKCDGLWNQPLKNWPKDIILFDPNNRGKYTITGQKLIPDQELVDILLTLPQVTIPQKYKDIVDAFRTMRKSQKDKSINKQHKAELCSTFKRITSLEKLDYALKNLWESGIFTEKVHYNLNKWWTLEAVDTTYDQKLSQVDINDAGKKEQPHILINISTKSITLTVEQAGGNNSQVSYDIPFNDELVPLKTMATTVSQTTIQKPLSDSNQKVTAKKYLTVSPKPDACPADNQTYSIIIPPDAMTVLNSYFPLDLYPNSQAILEGDIKRQHKMSSQETALCSTTHFDQPTSSTNQFSQLNQNITFSGKPGPILCTSYQSTTNSGDISSATKDSQNLDFHMQVSPTSDIGSYKSISSVNSESGNEEGDQNNISNGIQVLFTDLDYSSECVSKTNMKKRKCIEENRNEMKKRKIPSLKQDKETNHSKIAPPVDKSTISNTSMDVFQYHFDTELDSLDLFDEELNTLDNEDKNPQISDKIGNLMNGETKMSNENTNVGTYNSKDSTELEKLLQDMIKCEREKMLHMKSFVHDV